MAGPTLLIAMLLSIAVLMVLILRFRAHAVFALLAAGVVLGLSAGMKPLAIVSSFQKGMGAALLEPVPAGLLMHEAVGHRLEGSRLLSS